MQTDDGDDCGQQILKVLDDPNANSSDFITLLNTNQLLEAGDTPLSTMSLTDVVSPTTTPLSSESTSATVARTTELDSTPSSASATLTIIASDAVSRETKLTTVCEPSPVNAATFALATWAEVQATRPTVVIVEQPAENKLRFRYECEGRSTGAIQGVSSDGMCGIKTFPTVAVDNLQLLRSSKVVCVVSLVEATPVAAGRGNALPKYRTHPHNLVGKTGNCKNGISSREMHIEGGRYVVDFPGMGIQCVRRKDAPQSLAVRKQVKVDPFKLGFDHAQSAIDLNCVRLCFQVFVRTVDRGFFPLRPVVSNVIRDRKSHSDLTIVEISDNVSPAEGGKKLLLFTSKVTKDDIEVHFLHPNCTGATSEGGSNVVARADFTAADVHKQYGVAVRTPPLTGWPDQYANAVVQATNGLVYAPLYLYRPKTDTRSEHVDFWYTVSDVSPSTSSSSTASSSMMTSSLSGVGSPRQERNCSLPHANISGDGGTVSGRRRRRSRPSRQQELILQPITGTLLPTHTEMSSGQVAVPTKSSTYGDASVNNAQPSANSSTAMDTNLGTHGLVDEVSDSFISACIVTAPLLSDAPQQSQNQPPGAEFLSPVTDRHLTTNDNYTTTAVDIINNQLTQFEDLL